MNTLSIPMVAMAGISLYVGFYHLLIYLRHKQSRADLMFALLCFAYVFYAVFCAGLYNATSVAEGVQWQRAQFVTLAVFVPAFLWFVSDYTHQKPGVTLYLFSAFYLFAVIIQLTNRNGLTFLVSQPSIKSITLPYIQPITYYEAILGPFSTIQGLIGVVASTYGLIMGIRYFKRGYQREAMPLILAIVLMYAAGLHDTFVSNGIYHFIYLIEYAYLAVILLMANSLSNTVVEAAIAKEELRKSEERLRALVETTSDWVWEVDAKGIYTYASPKIRDLLGYEPEEVIGRTPFDMMPEEEAERVGVIFHNAMLQRKPLESLENISRRKDGELIILETNGVPFFDDYGRLLGYRGIDRDITERKRAQQALQAKTEELDRYFTSSLDLLCIADTDGYFHRLNPEWQTTLGYPIAELEGRQFLEFVHPADIEATRGAISRLADQQQVLNFENRYRCKDGSYRWIEWRSYPMGKTIYAVARDITKRKCAEEALSEKNHFIASLLRAIPVAVFYKDKKGNYLGCNDAFTKIMGVTAEEIRGKTVHELWPSELADKYHNMDLELMQSKGHQEYEYQVQARDGQMHSVIFAKDVYLDEDGEVTGLVGAFLDITERKQAEEALRESEQKFRLFVEQSSDGLVFTDEQGGILEWNQAQERMTGLSRQDAIGLPLWEIQSNMLPAHARTSNTSSGLKQRILLALESGHADFLDKPVEVELFRYDGTKIVIQQMTFAIKTIKGFRLGAIIRDITQLKQAEEELRVSEEKYRALVEVSPTATWIARNNIITYANPAALQVLGVTDPGEIVGRTAFDFIHPDYHAMVKERVLQMTEEGKVVPLLEEKYLRLDGSIVDVEVIATPFTTSEGTIIQVFFRDVTERKQNETEREALIASLEAKNAELERFTYTVSHDLKAPLITIRGFLGYMERDALSGDMNRLKGDMQRIVAATEKMQRLLSELLELSRIGRLMNPPQNIAFGDLVQEAIKLLEGQLQEKNIRVEIQDDLPIVSGDSQRLLEVVQNLLDNAVKFAGEQTKPVIEIGTQGEQDGMPVFYVRDNGIGIAPEHHERVFGLFNKLDPNAEGTGIGLAIVKRIVEVHGGRIWVESEAGQGATFYFTLGRGT